MDDKVNFFDESLRRHSKARHVLAKNSGHGITITDSDLVLEEVGHLSRELQHHPVSRPRSPPSSSRWLAV
jgi:hypothetical protein